jgi:hypothetical protein
MSAFAPSRNGPVALAKNRPNRGEKFQLKTSLRNNAMLPMAPSRRYAAWGKVTSKRFAIPLSPGRCIDPPGNGAGKKINGKKRHILVDTLGL